MAARWEPLADDGDLLPVWAWFVDAEAGGVPPGLRTDDGVLLTGVPSGIPPGTPLPSGLSCGPEASPGALARWLRERLDAVGGLVLPYAGVYAPRGAWDGPRPPPAAATEAQRPVVDAQLPHGLWLGALGVAGPAALRVTGRARMLRSALASRLVELLPADPILEACGWEQAATLREANEGRPQVGKERRAAPTPTACRPRKRHRRG